VPGIGVSPWSFGVLLAGSIEPKGTANWSRKLSVRRDEVEYDGVGRRVHHDATLSVQVAGVVTHAGPRRCRCTTSRRWGSRP